jgi:hypothetical protein
MISFLPFRIIPRIYNLFQLFRIPQYFLAVTKKTPSMKTDFQQATLNLFRTKLALSCPHLKEIALNPKRLRFHHVSFLDSPSMLLYLYVERKDLRIWEKNLCTLVYIAGQVFPESTSTIRIVSGLDDDTGLVDFEIPVHQFKQSREYKHWLLGRAQY